MIKTNRSTILLDGEWNIIYDYGDFGVTSKYYIAENFFKTESLEHIMVPSSWECVKPNYEGVAWYGKNIIVPKEFDANELSIIFDSVNYKCELWINGIAVNFHEGGYVGFTFEVSDFITFGEENFFCIRVVSPIIQQDIRIDGLGRNDMPHWRAALVAGIYQSVRLESHSSIYVKDTLIETDYTNGQITANIDILNNTLQIRDCDITVLIIDAQNEREVARTTLKHSVIQGEEKIKVNLFVEDYKLWSIEHPNLYWCKIILSENDLERTDEYAVRFGIRGIDFDKDGFILNGKHIYMKGVFNEDLFPHTLAVPESKDFILKEIMTAKEAGINLIRPWRRPLPTEIYDLADEIGMLYVGGVAIECMNYFPQITPHTQLDVEREFCEMIVRDKNHPCIIIWELFNEIHRMPLKRLKHKVSIAGRAKDPTRIILDESGGFAGGTNLYRPYSSTPVVINDIHNYPGSPFSQEKYDKFTKIACKDFDTEANKFTTPVFNEKLTNVSELGYGSMSELESNLNEYLENGNPNTPDYKCCLRLYSSLKKVMKENDLFSIYPTIDDYCKATQQVHYEGNKYMLEACKLNPQIGGVFIHAFADGDWVIGAGLVDIFRNPKKPYYAIKELFSELYLAVRSEKPNYFVGDTVKIKVDAISETNFENAEIYLSIECENTVIFEKAILTDIEKGVNAFGVFETQISQSGTYNITVKCNSIKNSYKIIVIDKIDWSDNLNEFALVDSQGKLKDFLHSNNVTFEDFTINTDISKPVIIADTLCDDTSEIYAKVAEWISRGGKAIYLETPDGIPYVGRTGRKQKYHAHGSMPFDLDLSFGLGLWIGKNHIVRDFKWFDGLPTNCMMDNNWMNIAPVKSFTDYQSDWNCGMITYDFFGGVDFLQNYYGVSEVYSASNIIDIKHGKGVATITTLKITPKINSDPFAQRILYNICKK